MQFDQHQALDQAAAAPLQGAEPFRLMPFGLELSLDGLPLQRLFRVSDCLDQHINGICRLSGAVQGGRTGRGRSEKAQEVWPMSLSQGVRPDTRKEPAPFQ